MTKNSIFNLVSYGEEFMAGLPDRNKDGLTDAAEGHHDILKDKVLIRLQFCVAFFVQGVLFCKTLDL